MGRINIEIENQMHKKAKAVCALKGTTLIRYINEALEEKLKREKKL